MQDRTTPIHANSSHPDAITANLPPYAAYTVNKVNNNSPSFQDPERMTLVELLPMTQAAANPKHWKPSGECIGEQAAGYTALPRVEAVVKGWYAYQAVTSARSERCTRTEHGDGACKSAVLMWHMTPRSDSEANLGKIKMAYQGRVCWSEGASQAPKDSGRSSNELNQKRRKKKDNSRKEICGR